MNWTMNVMKYLNQLNHKYQIIIGTSDFNKPFEADWML